MVIQVTQDHIQKGAQGNRWCCPVALALRDVFPGAFIQVSNVMYVNDTWAVMPRDIFASVQSYDKGDRMLPVEFEANFVNQKEELRYA